MDLMIPLIDMSDPASAAALDAILSRLRQTADLDGEVSRTVGTIVRDVATRGDDAVVELMARFTDPNYTADRIRVSEQDIEQALTALDSNIRGALELAISRVRRYQQHILPRNAKPVRIDDAELGLRFAPVDRCGLLVPGGRAAYPSTLIMLAVPALTAGVPAENIHIATPPPTGGQTGGATGGPTEGGGDVSPLVLATAGLLGLKNIYRVGGAQAVAAFALGTQLIPAVDLIAGPGNVYSQLAKLHVASRVGIDGFLGPSEIVTLADASARADWIAADLLAQAEHDPGKCFLIMWQREAMDRVLAEVARQLGQRTRRDAIEKALRNESAAILVRDEAQGVEIASRIAPEHMSLAVSDPAALLGRLPHAGEFFLGHQTPVAAGDYVAGPSHCLPTATSARYASGVSVYTFLKRSGTVTYPDPGGMSETTRSAIATLATAEGLDAHAASAKIRG